MLWRTTRRVVGQAITGEASCNGNRQQLGALMLGTDPPLGDPLRTGPQRHRGWPSLLRAPEHAHLAVHRLRSAARVAAWRRSPQAGKTPVDR